MLRNLPLICVALLCAPAARAQSVIFHEDFESGLTQWTAAFPWHTESDTSPCGGLVAPFPTGGQNVAYYGFETTCTFGEELSGNWFTSNLDLQTPVTIPATAQSATLRFWTYEEAECDVCGWDWRFVYASSDGGATWTFLGEGDRLGQWYEKTLDLSAFIGEDILLRFHFDPVDGWFNDFLGWMLDDVTIEIDGLSPSSFCTTSPNSAGAGALMGSSGSTSVAANDFALTVTAAPPNHFGKFYYGPEAIFTPFGDGRRCIGGGATGTFRLFPSMPTDANGAMTRLLDFTVAPAGSGSGAITPGSTWYFQFWYRDQVPGGTGFNLSDGLVSTFAP